MSGNFRDHRKWNVFRREREAQSARGIKKFARPGDCRRFWAGGRGSGRRAGNALGAKDARRARFRCVLALARNGEVLGVFEGIIEGQIADRPQGARGFGYDPIFVPKGFQQTFGELGPAEKNQLSHRARALKKLRAFLMPHRDQ